MRLFILQPFPHPSRALAKQAIDEAQDGQVVQIREPSRTLEQNAILWALLHDVAAQVVWYGRTLLAEDWKHIFTASLTKMDVVPNLENTGFVALGQSTSRMSKRELSDLIMLIELFGMEHDVKWRRRNEFTKRALPNCQRV